MVFLLCVRSIVKINISECGIGMNFVGCMCLIDLVLLCFLFCFFENGKNFFVKCYLINVV